MLYRNEIKVGERVIFCSFSQNFPATIIKVDKIKYIIELDENKRQVKVLIKSGRINNNLHNYYEDVIKFSQEYLDREAKLKETKARKRFVSEFCGWSKLSEEDMIKVEEILKKYVEAK